MRSHDGEVVLADCGITRPEKDFIYYNHFQGYMCKLLD